MACPRVNFRTFQCSEAIEAKFFHGETSHHRSVYHRAAQVNVTRAANTRQIAHESARESVAGSGRVVHLFEWKRGNTRSAILVDQHGPVFAALNHQHLWT